MKKSMSLNVLISALFALTSCSSKIVKKERLDQLKTVAIIGLDLEQQKPVSAGDLISVALKQSHTNQMVAGVRVDSIHTKSVFVR